MSDPTTSQIGPRSEAWLDNWLRERLDIHRPAAAIQSQVSYAVSQTAVPPGLIAAFAGSSAPVGYLLCDGASYLRADYPALFAVIGTTYGAVDGTHFNVPDCRGRAPVGKGSHADVDTLGENDGVAEASRTPKHQHGVSSLHTTGHPENIHSFASSGVSTEFLSEQYSPDGVDTDPERAPYHHFHDLEGSMDTATAPFIVANWLIKT